MAGACGCHDETNQAAVNVNTAAGAEADGLKDFSSWPGIPYTVATGEKAQDAVLTRGRYEIRGILRNEDNLPAFVEGKPILVATPQGHKRVMVNRFDVAAPDDSGDSAYVANIEVIDNPIPVAAVIWGAVGTATLTAGAFFVDKITKFTDSSSGAIALGVASLAGLFFMLRR